jgi:hypothetical protein
LIPGKAAKQEYFPGFPVALFWIADAQFTCKSNLRDFGVIADQPDKSNLYFSGRFFSLIGLRISFIGLAI